MANKSSPEVIRSYERTLERMRSERYRKLPLVSRIEQAGLAVAELGDGDLQQEAIELMCMEMVLDPGEQYKAADRLRAGAELAKLRGFSAEAKNRRVMEQIEAFKGQLKKLVAPEPKAVEARVLEAELVEEDDA